MRPILMILAAAVPLALAGCGDEDSGGMYACSFEESRTDGCDGMGFGPYEPDCYQFNSDDYVISPEQVCANVTDAGLHCVSSCCVDFRYRNVTLRSGGC